MSGLSSREIGERAVDVPLDGAVFRVWCERWASGSVPTLSPRTLMKGRARSPTISFTNFGGAGTNRALFPDFSVSADSRTANREGRHDQLP